MRAAPEESALLLLSAGCFLRQEGWTALIGAVDARKAEVVKLLLEQPQTDVNVVNAVRSFRGPSGLNVPQQVVATCLMHLAEFPSSSWSQLNGWCGWWAQNWTALSRASWHGDAQLVELLLSSKKIDNSMTPLFQAVRQGHIPVVKLLLKHPNIDPNRPAKEGKTALQQACCQSSPTLVDLVVRNKNTDVNSVDMYGMTALHEAATRGHVQLLKTLLKRGDMDCNPRDLQGRTPFWMACNCGDDNIESVNLMLKCEKVDVNVADDNTRTALMQACEVGNLNILAALLEHADIDVNAGDKNGVRPLHLACLRGQKELVKLLLKRSSLDVSVQTLDGETPIAAAIEYGTRNMVVLRLLVMHRGTELNRGDRCNRTPLWRASSLGYAPMVELLLQQKQVDPNRIDMELGCTPLFIAAANGHKQVMTSLLKHARTDIHFPDREGRTPLDVDRTNTIYDWVNRDTPYVKEKLPQDKNKRKKPVFAEAVRTVSMKEKAQKQKRKSVSTTGPMILPKLTSTTAKPSSHSWFETESGTGDENSALQGNRDRQARDWQARSSGQDVSLPDLPRSPDYTSKMQRKDHPAEVTNFPNIQNPGGGSPVNGRQAGKHKEQWGEDLLIDDDDPPENVKRSPGLKGSWM
ncbi:hypothetical protein CYMTET_35353 [Cymbomonas tetramitiformis]|uniref:Uncharacterized protein n=1 Tax=Cymbomonas tetramitiformis TaxID=36881 RepID=A0AAE0F9G8_9CHLO|nr:hypothetical protein CYMTET_35353 [Cymbomonas tetramitiformis]